MQKGEQSSQSSSPQESKLQNLNPLVQGIETKATEIQQKVEKMQKEIEAQMEEEEIKQLELMYSQAIEIMEKINQEKISVADVQTQIDKIRGEYDAFYNKYKDKIDKLEKAGLDDPRSSRLVKALKQVDEGLKKVEEKIKQLKVELTRQQKDPESPWIKDNETLAGP